MERQSGFTLIEILITVVILAVGLLGLAGMQVISLKNINNTQYRTLATLYAYDMAERMRSNEKGLEAYVNIECAETEDQGIECTGSDTEGEKSKHSKDAEEQEKTNCSSACSPADIALLDFRQWRESIRQSAENGGFPTGATGAVTKEGDVYKIKITWYERERVANAEENKGASESAKAAGEKEFVLTVRI